MNDPTRILDDIEQANDRKQQELTRILAAAAYGPPIPEPQPMRTITTRTAIGAFVLANVANAHHLLILACRYLTARRTARKPA